jgi:hypothetical protein
VPALPPGPEGEARAALAYLAAEEDRARREKRDSDAPYLRFASLLSVPPDDRREFLKLWTLWTRHLTLSPSRRVNWRPAFSSPTLLVIDLREAFWNADAWRAVATRDFRYRQPWVKDGTANELRRLAGEKTPANLHVVVLVDAWTLYRQTYDAQLSPSYYDLLFARQRFPGGGKGQWVATGTRNVQHGGGAFTHPAGTRYAGEVQQLSAGLYSVEEGRWSGGGGPKFVDFPATFQDWLSAFLADGAVRAIDDNADLLRVRHGAVCEGMISNPDEGSYVALHTRVVWYTPVPTGWLSQTFDVFDEAGETDLLENAFTDEAADRARIKFDAGEALIRHPAGDAVASLLFDGKFKRVEAADPRAARHTRDKADPVVNTGGDCMACHAGDYGLIPLRNRVELDTPGEVDVNFKDKLRKGRAGKVRADNFDAFFLGWQPELEGPRASLKRYWQEATADRLPLPAAPKLAPLMPADRSAVPAGSWDGTKFGNALMAWKNRYDRPVDVAQQERETGYPARLLQLAASQVAGGKNADGKDAGGRMTDVARGKPIPRQTWDKDAFPILMTYLEAEAVKLDKPKGAP